MKLFSSFLIFITFSISLYGQGIRGVIADESGETLPYASIYIKEKGTGTSSNSEGLYELRLPPGTYEVTYQFVGYTTEVRQVIIANGFQTLNIRLNPQVETLTEVSVTGSAEDPAYTIMRKAIAKAPFHLLQYDGYSAEVYMKGTGKMNKIPGLFEKMAANEGVDTARVFTSESVSEISFEKPNVFKEKVISVRTSGEDMSQANPNSYINTSFYLPEVVGSVSPLSPKAFSYYRFRYLANFVDRGSKVHKIEVKPRSKGDKVFDGTIYIRDEFWNIHSLELQTKIEFYDVFITQFFAPVQGEIWMPITQRYEFSVSLLGFAGVYKYLASVSNYEVDKNEDLDASVVLVDEDIEKRPPEIEAIKDGEVEQGMKEVFKEDREVSRKQFNKLIKKYEKEERKEAGNEDIVSDYSYTVDSTAAKKDSAYWASVRPVPLTGKEEDGYRKDDSIYVAESQDSTRQAGKNRFGVGDAFFGGRFQLNDNTQLKIPGLLARTRFNTVEGFNMDLAATLIRYVDTNIRYELTPVIRYGFASTNLYGKLNMKLITGSREDQSEWELEAGRYIRQFHTNAINPFINSLYSLLLERNYMKLYEEDFIKLNFRRNFKYKIDLAISAKWASRSNLSNFTGFSLFDLEKEVYSDNVPDNIENPTVVFENSGAFNTAVDLKWKPWLKYRKYNGRLIPLSSFSPEFRMGLRSGWNGFLGSETDFHLLEVGLNTAFKLGVRASFDLDLEGGGFLQNKNLLFMDYKHFEGGLTEFAPLNVTGNYRALDYYLYSTRDAYISALSHIRFRKLLLTRVPILRISGIKENLIFNYLKTGNSPHYTEVGYGIDNIFRILRLELVQSFEDFQPTTFSVRIGVTSLIQIGRR